jgi:hypothetical protein
MVAFPCNKHDLVPTAKIPTITGAGIFLFLSYLFICGTINSYIATVFVDNEGGGVVQES